MTTADFIIDLLGRVDDAMTEVPHHRQDLTYSQREVPCQDAITVLITGARAELLQSINLYCRQCLLNITYFSLNISVVVSAVQIRSVAPHRPMSSSLHPATSTICLPTWPACCATIAPPALSSGADRTSVSDWASPGWAEQPRGLTPMPPLLPATAV